MSDTVGYKGKLEPVEADSSETIEETCERVCDENGIELSPYMDTFLEEILESEDYIVLDDILYKFLEKDKFNYDSIAEATENSDGTIDFLCVFYNGGASLGEVLEDAIEAM